MKKTISVLAILAILVIMLSGCAKVDYQVKVEKDGKGEIVYLYGIDKTVIKSTGQTPEDVVKNKREEAIQAGYEVEPYEDDKIAGFKATKKIEDLSQKPILLEIFKEEYIPDKEKSKIYIKKTILGERYSQSTKVDLTSIKQFKELGLNLKYSLTLPTKVDETNADEISKDGKTIIWKFTPGEIKEIKFEAVSRNFTIWLLIIIFIIVVIAILQMFLKGKKQKGIQIKYEYKDDEKELKEPISKPKEEVKQVPVEKKVEKKAKIEKPKTVKSKTETQKKVEKKVEKEKPKEEKIKGKAPKKNVEMPKTLQNKENTQKKAEKKAEVEKPKQTKPKAMPKKGGEKKATSKKTK